MGFMWVRQGIRASKDQGPFEGAGRVPIISMLAFGVYTGCPLYMETSNLNTIARLLLFLLILTMTVTYYKP